MTALPEENWGRVVVIDPKYAPMVARLEEVAERNPFAYRCKVLAAGLLGYLVVGGLLFLVAAPIALIFAFVMLSSVSMPFFLRFVLAASLVGLLLFFTFRLPRIPRPGFLVRQDKIPALFEMIEKVRQRMGARALDEVRIYGGINAGVMEEKRLGGLITRSVLRIGLPLLYALPEADFEALMAHEFGHLINRHSGSLQFVSRLRERWLQLGGRLSTGAMAGLLRRFFAWYGPWYVAYSQVLFRRQELEADATAARIVGADALAAALCRVAVKAFRFNEIAADEALAVRRGLTPSEIWRWLFNSLSADYVEDLSVLTYQLSYREGLSDSHPSLKRRLAALGSKPIAPRHEVPAADRLLGSSVDNLIEQLVAG